MVKLALCVIAMAPLGTYLIATRAAVRPFGLSLVWFTPIAVGVAYRSEGRPELFWRILLFELTFLALVVGYLYRGTPRGGYERKPGLWWPVLHPGGALLVVLLFAVYHFSKVGFAALGDDVERARWEFTGSGFYGIPARAFQVGIPIAAAMAARITPTGTKSYVRRAAAITLLAWGAAFVLSGFKNGVFTTVVVVLAVFWTPSWEASLRDRARVRRRTFAAGLVALTAALVLIAATGLGSTGSATETLSTRISEIPAEAALDTLELIDEERDLGARPTYLTELVILSQRALPFLDDSGRWVFNEWVSAYRSGRFGEDQFRVPVTPTGPVTAQYNFGVLAAPFYALLGSAWRRCEMSAASANGGVPAAIASILLIGLHSHLTRGGFAFFALNYTLVFALVFTSMLFVRIGRAVSPRSAPANAHTDYVNAR